ncbi:MAG: RcpC/CpaB family pilus assembly protein [Candidatus Dormibacteria bacterium]
MTDLKGRVNQVSIAIGLILAIAAFGAAYYLIRANSNQSPTAPTTGQLVVVAKVSIPSGALITSGMLEETRIKGLLPANTFTNCAQLVRGTCSTSAGVSGGNAGSTAPVVASYYATVPITADTVITGSLVSPNKSTQQPSTGNLNLPAGEVALAVQLNANETVGGYLQPGDHIDFVASDSNGGTDFAYEDIPVLAVGAPGSASNTSGGSLVILQVTRSQALGISEMVKSGTVYTVVLRSSSDYGHGYVPTSADSAANDYNQACVAGTSVNPIIEEDLQEAKQAVKSATTTFDSEQKQYNKDNTTLQQATGTAVTAAKAQVLTDASTLAQDQFALVEAENEMSSDQSVLYCGAQNAAGASGASGLGSGSPGLIQSLFGFSIGGGGGS